MNSKNNENEPLEKVPKNHELPEELRDTKGIEAVMIIETLGRPPEHLIETMEEIVKNTEIIAHEENHEVVSIGSTVIIKANDSEVKYTIVGSNEANPAAGKISNESLVGKALIGAKVDSKVKVETPAGTTEYTVTHIE